MACSFDAALKTIDALISNTKLSNKREGLLSIKARIERMRDTAKVQSSANSYDKIADEKIAKTAQKPQKDARVSATKPNYGIMDKAKAIGAELGLRSELVNETIAKLEKCSKG